MQNHLVTQLKSILDQTDLLYELNAESAVLALETDKLGVHVVNYDIAPTSVLAKYRNVPLHVVC